MAIDSVEGQPPPGVLDHGALIEEGTGGLYARLYALQATAYQDGNAEGGGRLDDKM